jgi:Amt family ammonium transporter
LFASKLINPAAADGLFHGNPRQLLNPAIAVQVAWIHSRVVSLVIINLIDWAIGLRVDLDQEIEGLDSSQHGETGYSLEA